MSDDYELVIGSDLFHRICDEMNLAEPDPLAAPAFDGMSGGFKFADESPPRLRAADSPVLLPFIGLLRHLWGYRISIVRGTPRAELEQWWEAVKASAPHWPGFQPERSSVAMLPFSQECMAKSQALTEGLDLLDAKCRKVPV